MDDYYQRKQEELRKLKSGDKQRSSIKEMEYIENSDNRRSTYSPRGQTFNLFSSRKKFSHSCKYFETKQRIKRNELPWFPVIKQSLWQKIMNIC